MRVQSEDATFLASGPPLEQLPNQRDSCHDSADNASYEAGPNDDVVYCQQVVRT